MSRSFQRSAAGAPPPCRSFASLRNAPLDAAISQIHRCGPGAPGRNQGPRPSGTPPAAGRGERGPFTPLRCPGLCEGSPAVTTPRRGCASLHLPPLDAACFQGVVTAHSRVPRQRSRPTREASLGLRLTSALSGDRSVGLSVARHLVWGRGCRARSRRIWRCTGTAPAAGSLGRTSPPVSIRGNRACAAGQDGRTTWIVASNNRGPFNTVRIS